MFDHSNKVRLIDQSNIGQKLKKKMPIQSNNTQKNHKLSIKKCVNFFLNHILIFLKQWQKNHFPWNCYNLWAVKNMQSIDGTIDNIWLVNWRACQLFKKSTIFCSFSWQKYDFLKLFLHIINGKFMFFYVLFRPIGNFFTILDWYLTGQLGKLYLTS